MAIAAANHGIVSREQALEVGLTPPAIHGLLVSGEWVEMHGGTYRMGSTEPSWKTRLMAAVRAAERCPKGGRNRTVVVSHQAAAALHGVRPHDSALPEISVDGRTLPKLKGVKVHRSTGLDDCDIQLVHGIPVTNGVRMLIDLAGVLPDTKFVVLLDDTICARVASRRRTYKRALELRPGRPHVARLVALTEPGAEGTFRSWLERTTSEGVTAAGLPQPRWNVRIHDGRGLIGVVDAYWDWVPLIMELEGLRFHTQPAERQRDAERFNRLTDLARVRRFTYRDVMDRPDYVMAALREALAGAPAPEAK